MGYEENKTKFKFFDDNIQENINENATVLDIGFGTGAFCYRLYHLFGITDLYGVEKGKEEDAGQFIDNIKTNDWAKGYRSGVENNFQLYQQFLKYELNENEDLYIKPKIEHKTAFIYVFENLKNETSFDVNCFEKRNLKFDLIIASDILHFNNNEGCNGLDCIDEYLKILKPNGYLYLSILLENGTNGISITLNELELKIENLNLGIIDRKEINKKNLSKILLFVSNK